MRRLLVPVDGSPTAERAVAHAIDLARRWGDCMLVLLNVQQDVEHWNRGGLLDTADRAQLKQAGVQAAASARSLVEAAGVDHEFLVVYGRPGETIVQEAGAHRCNGIVMGTRGLGELAQVFLGSTANKVVQLAEVPVTLVK